MTYWESVRDDCRKTLPGVVGIMLLMFIGYSLYTAMVGLTYHPPEATPAVETYPIIEAPVVIPETPNIIGPLKPTPSGPAVTAWEIWMSEHSKTCPECGGFPDHGMCMEAFTKFQAALRADKPIITPPVVSEPTNPPSPKEVSASSSSERTYSAPRTKRRFFGWFRGSRR